MLGPVSVETAVAFQNAHQYCVGMGEIIELPLPMDLGGRNRATSVEGKFARGQSAKRSGSKLGHGPGVGAAVQRRRLDHRHLLGDVRRRTGTVIGMG